MILGLDKLRCHLLLVLIYYTVVFMSYISILFKERASIGYLV